MNKEVPLFLVKSNQAGVVAVILLAIVTQQPILLLLLWVIQAVGLVFGTKASLFIRIVQPFLRGGLEGSPTQSVELQRFNQTLGMLFLTVSLICFLFQMNTAGYILASMFAAAAFLSVCGFCVGCLMYYQYKQLRHRMSR